jgi:UDP-N-acetylglucosamine:LPS N-acetylglucosamine transferase
MTGDRLVREVMQLAAEPGRLEEMGRAAKAFARPGAARRAAEILESLSR